jgi:5-methylcytosine-specific restriction endonuclease McrA
MICVFLSNVSSVHTAKQEEALRIKVENPGISMTAIASKMGISVYKLKALLEPIGEYSAKNKQHIQPAASLKNYPAKKSVNLFEKLAKIRHGGVITCDICGITQWRNIPLINIIEKDHVDGNPNNNNESNLRTLCPNCHSQTTTRLKIQDSHPSRFDTSLSKQNVIISENDVLVSEEMQKRLKTLLGKTGPTPSNAYSLEDIMDGKVPTYRTSRYVGRLIGAGFKPNYCECCKATEWRGIPIRLFLVGHHKDGNATNHKFENLEVLCPNCHGARHSFESVTNPVHVGQQATYLTSNAVSYNLDSELVQRIKTLLESPNRPASMVGCAKELGISKKQLKTITIKMFPDLWVTDMGSARRLNLNDSEVKNQIAIIDQLRKMPGHTKFGGMKKAVQEYNIPRKRYLVLYERVFEQG